MTHAEHMQEKTHIHGFGRKKGKEETLVDLDGDVRIS
jgi:hypothetical protein